MFHNEAVSAELIDTLRTLQSIPELDSFRLVGGTAIALQIGHRKSVDIDLFCNERTDKARISHEIKSRFHISNLTVTETNLAGEVNGVRLELYDHWMMPFKKPAVVSEGLRVAALEDLAAFKLSAITGRREKKDYVDLYFLFDRLGSQNVLENFKSYDPLLSSKSILFALSEVKTAKENKSPMPDMLVAFDWRDAVDSMLSASKVFLAQAKGQGKDKDLGLGF